MIVEPLELEVIAAVADPSDEVRIVDMILEKKPLAGFIHEFNPDVLCVTGYITHIPQIIDYCRKAKEINPDIITVAGGVHIEKCPEDCDDEAVDYRIIRNATRLFPRLLDFIRNGKTGDLPPGVLGKNQVADPAKLPAYDFYFPVPRRNLTQAYRKHYFYVFHDRVALLKTSFGCPYHCNFCYCRKITDDNYHERPMDEVMEELEQISEKEIYIIDDDFLFSPKRVREFITELEKRNLKKRFLVYGRADFITSNPGIIKDFRKNGLRTIIIGLESFNDNELEGYNKKLLAQVNKNALQILNDNKVDCYAAIILSPSWDRADFLNLQKEIKNLKLRFLNLQPLTPLPLTGIEVADDSLVVDRRDYPLWDLAHVTIKPAKMGLPEYYALIMQTYMLTLFRWSNLYHHSRYPLHLHWRMIKGVAKVFRQYRSIYKASQNYA